MHNVGIGLRPPHYADFLASPPAVGWVEVISENFLGAGGPPRALLRRVRERCPVVLHGVSLSIGSSDPLDDVYLQRLRALADDVEAAWVSDHLSWGVLDGRRGHDLWPIPPVAEALAHVVDRVDAVQARLGRRILLENVSAYVAWRDAEMTDGELLAEVVRQTGCGVLLDVNNLWVTAQNLGRDARAMLAEIPADAVGQMHLAGHRDLGTHLLDSHDRPVAPEVWALYEEARARFGAVPVCLERDDDLPPLAALVEEALRAA
jgi:uncharacterized protein